MLNFFKLSFVATLLGGLALDLKGIGVPWSIFGIDNPARVPSTTALLVFIYVFWLAPSMVAAYRDHPHKWPILIANLLIVLVPVISPEWSSASILGWAACFVWVAMPVRHAAE